MFWPLLVTTALGVAAAPSPQAAPPRPNPSACAQISNLASSQLASNPSNTPTFLGSLAFDCLRTVPNRPGPAQKLIESLKTFVQWQSTLAWLKDPPKSYGFTALDVLGSLDDIAQRAAAGDFASEYDFQVAIVQVVTAAHDGHFFYRPDIFKAFSFQNGLAGDIVSVSVDGVSLPKLYRLSALQSQSGGQPLAIVQINDQDAIDFLVNLSVQFGTEQDIDAQWNSLFQIYANQLRTNEWGFGSTYLGPSLKFTYEDGSFETQRTVATLNRDVDFTGIRSGDDFYDVFCNPDLTVSPAKRSSPAGHSQTKRSLMPREPATSAYPPPIVQNSKEGTTMGFFLDGKGFEDIAVLAISSFSEDDPDTYLDGFQKTVQDFLSQCRQAGKERLVIDLTANTGGFIAAGFELFAQLFPGTNEFTANNMRITEALVNMSKILSSASPEDQRTAIKESVLLDNISPADVARPQGDKFGTFDDILSPVTLLDDKFSQYIGEASLDFNITGTGDGPDPPPPVFKPENIVLLTDGACDSTCTTFSYLMLFQKQVKTVSVGGRPVTGPMQSIGGVEGGQSLGMSLISAGAHQVLGLVEDEAEAEKYQAGELGTLEEGYALLRSSSAEFPGGINFKNNFAPYDSKTPLQFLYEPANCRFFYTPDMIYLPDLVWQYAVLATWSDPDRYCVKDSITPVDAAKALDPAFAKASEKTGGDGNPQTGGSGGTNGDGGSTTNGAKDQDDGPDNAAGRVFAQGGLRVASLLAVVSVMMLYL